MKKNPWIAIPRLSEILALAGLVVISGSGISCVTVNVNIPDSAVQQATDDYVRELYEEKEKSKSPSPTPSHQSLLDVFIASAYADETIISTHSAKALDIRSRMKNRLDDLQKFKSAGLIGESKDGQLVVKNKPKASQEKAVHALVTEENADRAQLYQEIIQHNSMNKGNLETIERNFAHSFQKHSPSGTWVQDDEGAWSQKP